MSQSPYQFLNEVIKSSDISGSLLEAYPWMYQVLFALENEPEVFVSEYRALAFTTKDKVEKRWKYDYGSVNGEIFNIQLKVDASTDRRSVN